MQVTINQKMNAETKQEIWLILKLIALTGVISAGIKILGQFLTLDTPPAWVPIMVVGGTMGGAGLLLGWQTWRDSRQQMSPRRPSGAEAHKRPPPPETGD